MPVTLKPEPHDFYEKVQKMGEELLAANPNVKGSQLQPYWRKIKFDLYDAYSGICAYTCHWITRDTGSITVDHFKPKDKYPQDAYQWANYRLACGTLNGRKGINKEVLDPFTLQEGWFALHFPSLQLTHNKELDQSIIVSIKQTIKILKLNDDTCIGGRRDWLEPYLQGEYGIDHLCKKAPFLTYELKRQGLQDINLPIWDAFKK
ncbi:hypothetical protein ccbrp13_38990 [Ktedonobacteria bacterium brp13]|nr:hypothetical protein ccbrp13_38990 [Ktedonobacteria bacterium brp13]